MTTHRSVERAALLIGGAVLLVAAAGLWGTARRLDRDLDATFAQLFG